MAPTYKILRRAQGGSGRLRGMSPLCMYRFVYIRVCTFSRMIRSIQQTHATKRHLGGHAAAVKICKAYMLTHRSRNRRETLRYVKLPLILFKIPYTCTCREVMHGEISCRTVARADPPRALQEDRVTGSGPWCRQKSMRTAGRCAGSNRFRASRSRRRGTCTSTCGCHRCCGGRSSRSERSCKFCTCKTKESHNTAL